MPMVFHFYWLWIMLVDIGVEKIYASWKFKRYINDLSKSLQCVIYKHLPYPVLPSNNIKRTTK